MSISEADVQKFWQNAVDTEGIEIGRGSENSDDDRASLHHMWLDLLQNTPPDVAYKTLTVDLPVGARVSFIKAGGDVELSIMQPKDFGEVSDKSAFVYSRRLGRDDDGVLYSFDGDIRLSANLQGAGLGKILQRNMIRLLRDAGYCYISDQSVDIGAYAWAKMGYEFNANALDIEQRRELSALYNERLREIAPFIPEEEYTKARRYVSLQKPGHINNMADLSYSFNAAVRDQVSQRDLSLDDVSASPLLVASYDYMNRRLNRFQADDFKTLWQEFNNTGDQFTLGKYLLLKSGWPGRLELQDVNKMQRVENFLTLANA